MIPSEHRTQMGSDGKSTNFRWFGDVSGTFRGRFGDVSDTNVPGESPGEWLQIQSSPHHFIELPVHPRDAGVDVGCCVRFDCPVILKWFPVSTVSTFLSFHNFHNRFFFFNESVVSRCCLTLFPPLILDQASTGFLMGRACQVA